MRNPQVILEFRRYRVKTREIVVHLRSEPSFKQAQSQQILFPRPVELRFIELLRGRPHDRRGRLVDQFPCLGCARTEGVAVGLGVKEQEFVIVDFAE